MWPENLAYPVKFEKDYCNTKMYLTVIKVDDNKYFAMCCVCRNKITTCYRLAIRHLCDGVAFLCCDCYESECENLIMCKKPHNTTINTAVLLIPSVINYCNICERMQSSAFYLIVGHNNMVMIEICRSCVNNCFDQALRWVDFKYRRKIIETIYVRLNGEWNHTKYICKRDKRNIANERAIIKQSLNLPQDLRNIVMTYYWAFEQLKK